MSVRAGPSRRCTTTSRTHRWSTSRAVCSPAAGITFLGQTKQCRSSNPCGWRRARRRSSFRVPPCPTYPNTRAGSRKAMAAARSGCCGPRCIPTSWSRSVPATTSSTCHGRQLSPTTDTCATRTVCLARDDRRNPRLRTGRFPVRLARWDQAVAGRRTRGRTAPRSAAGIRRRRCVVQEATCAHGERLGGPSCSRLGRQGGANRRRPRAD